MKELRPVLLGTRILPAHAHDWITIGLRITSQVSLMFELGLAAAATNASYAVFGTNAIARRGLSTRIL